MVQFNAHFDGQSIMPDETVNIPVNVPLRVTIESLQSERPSEVDWQRLLALASECAVDGPEDLAQRHDHYAHGKSIE